MFIKKLRGWLSFTLQTKKFRVQIPLESLKIQKMVMFRQFQNDDSLDAYTWNEEHLTVNKRLLYMKCSQKSCDKSVSTKYPVSKVRTPYPLTTRIQNLHLQYLFWFLLLVSLHFFVWWSTRFSTTFSTIFLTVSEVCNISKKYWIPKKYFYTKYLIPLFHFTKKVLSVGSFQKKALFATVLLVFTGYKVRNISKNTELLIS